MRTCVADDDDIVVLALPRGGVPVGYEVATALAAPLDVCVVRKLGVPGHEELAMGALAGGDTVVMNRRVVDTLRVSERVIEAVIASERAEVTRRERAYRGDRRSLELRNRTVLLVDDGLATGATMRAAVLAARQHDPARIVVAVPVAAAPTVGEFEADGNDVVVVATPSPYYAVGQAYEDFSQTTDHEVRELLRAAAQR